MVASSSDPGNTKLYSIFLLEHDKHKKEQAEKGEAAYNVTQFANYVGVKNVGTDLEVALKTQGKEAEKTVVSEFFIRKDLKVTDISYMGIMNDLVGRVGACFQSLAGSTGLKKESFWVNEVVKEKDAEGKEVERHVSKLRIPAVFFKSVFVYLVFSEEKAMEHLKTLLEKGTLCFCYCFLSH